MVDSPPWGGTVSFKRIWRDSLGIDNPGRIRTLQARIFEAAMFFVLFFIFLVFWAKLHWILFIAGAAVYFMAGAMIVFDLLLFGVR